MEEEAKITSSYFTQGAIRPMALAERTATTVWTGDLASGSGELTFGTGAIGAQPVSWAARTESSDGKTSPEELLAAAQASCLAMALSAGLARAGHPADRLEVRATATLDRVDGAPTVTQMDIRIEGSVPGMGEAAFEEAARAAASGCPIARALKGNVHQNVSARLLTTA